MFHTTKITHYFKDFETVDWFLLGVIVILFSILILEKLKIITV